MKELPEKKYADRLSESGMSMIEVAVVVLLTTIILAIATPNISNVVRAYKLRNAADHMAERLSAVRALSMAKNRNVTFSLNNATARYGFDFTGTAGDGAPDTIDPDDPSTIYSFVTLPSDIAADFPGNAPISVTFNSRGELPIGAAEQVITLRNDLKAINVRVNLRGKISVE